LTDVEASKTYGDPPQPLLAAGIAKDVNDLLTKKYGAEGFEIQQLEVTWSEELAFWLNRMSPIFLGLGLVGLFLEFKVPSHGLFAAAGVALLAVVFLSSYVAGLSGHEPMLVFAAGLLLLAAEIFFVPGSVLLGLSGLVLMLGSLVWAMADIWPGEPISVAWAGDAFARPIANLGLGLVVAVVVGVALWRFLPSGWFVDRLVVHGASGGAAQAAGLAPELARQLGSLVGQRGVAATALRPGGQVEIDGRRFEATVEVGAIDAGATVVVRGQRDFSLIVEQAET
jgi:membrane-bound serine protease (ClpP class)